MGESGFGFTNCDVVAEIVFFFFLTIQLLQIFLFGLGFFFFSFAVFVCGKVYALNCMWFTVCARLFSEPKPEHIYRSDWLKILLGKKKNNVKHKRMSSTQITHHVATGNVPELRVCLETVWKCWSAWARPLNVFVLWPVLHEMDTLYSRPRRRWEIWRRSLTWTMRSIPRWKRCGSPSIESWQVVCPQLRVCVCMPAGIHTCYHVPL